MLESDVHHNAYTILIKDLFFFVYNRLSDTTAWIVHATQPCQADVFSVLGSSGLMCAFNITEAQFYECSERRDRLQHYVSAVILSSGVHVMVEHF